MCVSVRNASIGYQTVRPKRLKIGKEDHIHPRMIYGPLGSGTSPTPHSPGVRLPNNRVPEPVKSKWCVSAKKFLKQT